MRPPEKKSISIIHHHLEPGGVTEVIGLSVRAMAGGMPELEEIRLVSGRSGGGERVVRELRAACAAFGVSVELKIVPEIDYLSADASPGREIEELTRSIKAELLRSCSGSVWMVHNYHLGKNPAFTRAVIDIAANHQDERICFYIHDFPECSRYENLSFLRRFYPESPYPLTSNVRYLVINSRDYNYLCEAGIPDSMVFLLHNPVPAAALPGGNREALKAKLETNLAQCSQAYVPGAPLLIYPVRTIRRKNVFEMGVICAASPAPVNLVVTLPGTSHTERGYSDKVSAAFAAGLIPGLWGIGTRLENAGLSFPELVSIADVICSSSVQEGFGYLFINAVEWRIPLLARYIEVLDGIVSVFEDHPSYFYRTFKVPANPSQIATLTEAYEGKARKLATLAGDEIVESVMGQFSRVTDGETVDFSYLPLDGQIEVLKRIHADTSYLKEVVGLNGELYSAMRGLIATRGGSWVAAPAGPAARDGSSNGAVSSEGAQAPEWPFSFERYAKTVEKIIDSFGLNPEPAREKKPDVQASLIRRFADIEYLRLLYGN